MTKDDTLMMDRVLDELKEFNTRLQKFLEELELYHNQGKVPDELYDEARSLKEKMSDLLTIAVNWRQMADLNGVDLG